MYRCGAAAEFCGGEIWFWLGRRDRRGGGNIEAALAFGRWLPGRVEGRLRRISGLFLVFGFGLGSLQVAVLVKVRLEEKEEDDAKSDRHGDGHAEDESDDTHSDSGSC